MRAHKQSRLIRAMIEHRFVGIMFRVHSSFPIFSYFTSIQLYLSVFYFASGEVEEVWRVHTVDVCI